MMSDLESSNVKLSNHSVAEQAEPVADHKLDLAAMATEKNAEFRRHPARIKSRIEEIKGADVRVAGSPVRGFRRSADRCAFAQLYGYQESLIAEAMES